VLGFAVVRRAEADDVAIIRNEHGVELNLVFNPNAGDPATNILMDVRDKYPRLHSHRAARRVYPGNRRRAEQKRHSDCPGTSQFWRERADFGVRARP